MMSCIETRLTKEECTVYKHISATSEHTTTRSSILSLTTKMWVRKDAEGDGESKHTVQLHERDSVESETPRKKTPPPDQKFNIN